MDYERLTLFVLKLGHSALAEDWHATCSLEHLTGLDATGNPRMQPSVDSLYRQKVLPVFERLDQECFSTRFLRHILMDIASIHRMKPERRFRPLIALAKAHFAGLRRLRLRVAPAF